MTTIRFFGRLLRTGVSPRRSALLGVLAALLLGACQPPATPLRIGTNVWQGYEPLYLARDLGYFGDRQIRLVEYTSATQLLQAFRNGAIDGATLTLDEVLQVAEDEQDLSIPLILDFSHGADALVARPGIGSLAALRGKRVGLENTALGAYMLTRAMQKAGLTPKDVVPVTVRVDEHWNAYRDKQVDALVTFEPARSRLRDLGAKDLFNSADIPNEIMDVLVLRRAVVSANADGVQAVLRGWFRALDFIRENPAAAALRMSPRLGVSPETVTATFDELKLADRQANQAMLSADPPQLRQIGENLQTIMRFSQLLRGPVDVNGLIDPGPLRRLDK